MPNDLFGANDFTIEELEELFNEDDNNQQTTPPADANPQSSGDAATVTDTNASNVEDVTKTQAFARRLRESTDKARREERDTIAKSLGYDSYDAMQKAREKELLDSKGLNPEDVSPVIEQIVKQRLDNDPRMLELAELKSKQELEFGKRELAEITKLTGGEITELSQISPEVLELWKTKGSLKAAFLEKEGEKLITKIRSEHSKGSTSHLANPSSSVPGQPTVRHLTAEEKQMWKVFHPHITDEELNKKTVNI